MPRRVRAFHRKARKAPSSPGVPRCCRAAGWVLAFALALVSLSSATTAQAASGQPQLSTPISLTSLAVGGTASVLLDSQRHFHLLYPTTAPQRLVNLAYQVVSTNGQSVQIIRKAIILSRAAERIDSSVFVLDSRSRLHALWIELRDGVFSVHHALLEDPTTAGAGSITPETLYQSKNSLHGMSGGADKSGNIFCSWLDSSSGTPNAAAVEIHDDQSVGNPLQLTHQTDGLAFLHLVVYPDDTLVGVMLHRPGLGSWDVIMAPFDATGKSLHDPSW